MVSTHHPEIDELIPFATDLIRENRTGGNGILR